MTYDEKEIWVDFDRDSLDVIAILLLPHPRVWRVGASGAADLYLRGRSTTHMCVRGIVNIKDYPVMLVLTANQVHFVGFFKTLEEADKCALSHINTRWATEE